MRPVRTSACFSFYGNAWAWFLPVFDTVSFSSLKCHPFPRRLNSRFHEPPLSTRSRSMEHGHHQSVLTGQLTVLQELVKRRLNLFQGLADLRDLGVVRPAAQKNL
jgi:hypothetical protein